MNTIPLVAKEAVLMASKGTADDDNHHCVDVNGRHLKTTDSILDTFTTQVKGYDFNEGINHSALLQTYLTTGFQATSFGQSVQQIEQMLKSRDEPFEEDVLESDNFIRRKTGCTIFLGYTSNMISSGVRDTIRFLVQHKMVDCIVTSAGGVEEDIIKCLGPTFVGDFSLKGSELRDEGINRIGNLLVPNDNYCKFENWVQPVLDQMLAEQHSSDGQQQQKIVWSPSKVITRLGEKINNEESILYWAARNQIPVFCPALTDGSLGDMIYFHTYRNPGLVIDIVQDIRRLNTIAVKARKSAMIILGGGLVKHHICNANLMRNGADYSVFINTANEFDGSDAGARPDEAVSWGKIKREAKPVKIYADASIIFPLLVAETFARHHHYSVSKKNC
ncbi:probable deoxyhypusine synthase isoform X2 [Oppia nitens]|uniref:probable deoxyhypusine synthase isoform X2 n=1 Tax=Oppia nitens TaxID=1686743 RepID=UPI0023DCCAD9|nr:probable deoxyhypusine synthase isoform X2 [Oppia nitens]